MDFSAGGLDQFADFEVGRDVGSAETIDRLLRIADDEQRSGARPQLSPILLFEILACQIEQDFCLQRIGVLKLVDQHVRKSMLEVTAHGRMIAQHVARECEEILKGERAVPAAFHRECRGGWTKDLERDSMRML